jgi:hypothetical protein
MDEGITEGFLSRLGKEEFFFVYTLESAVEFSNNMGERGWYECQRLRVFVDAYSKDFVDSAFKVWLIRVEVQWSVWVMEIIPWVRCRRK